MLSVQGHKTPFLPLLSYAMKPPPNRLLLTAVLLLACTMCTFSARNCPNCGTTPVPYPFSTDPTCGDPRYQIRCNSGTLLFDTLNTSYPIISINPSIQRLVIQPASLLPNTCVTSDYIYEGIRLNDSLPFNITTDNTILYLNCTELLLRSPLNCSSTSLCHVYVNSTRGEAPCQAASLCCTFRGGGSTTAHRIKVRETGCRAYTSFVNLEPDSPVDKWPVPGLSIQWALPQENPQSTKNARKTRGFIQKRGKWSIPVFSVTLTIFLILMFAYLCRRKKIKTKERLIAAFLENGLKEGRQSADLPFFDLAAISAATKNFSPAKKIGQGGFGSVYKGQLPDRQDIAVKRLSKSSGQGIQEFKNEILLIARLQHKNLVKLLGCCIQGGEQMLIYEYLPNRSLDLFIFDQTKRLVLDWRKRFDIIVGIARGVLYLHHDSRLRIIHRDLKTSNVLLDAEMNPKISDFGLARIFEGDQVQDKTNRVVGTYGYMSPEYAVFGKFSLKSDVFSYGVILLEIISSKKSNTSYQNDSSLNLIGHVWDLWREDRALEIVDSSLMESYVPSEVFRCIQIGLLCVQEDATDRPAVQEVVLMLNGEKALPQPKQPAFTFRRNSIHLNPSTLELKHYSVNEVTVTNFEPR